MDGTLLVSDASTGLRMAELPWSGMQRNRVLSGAGQLSCSMPVGHPAVTRDNLGLLRSSPDRLVTFYRDGEAVWSGFISGSDCTWSDGVFNLIAREFPWILSKRALEVNKDYDGWDVFDIIRDLIDYLTSKVSTDGDSTLAAGSDIIAAIPYLSVSPAVTDAGATLSFTRSPTIYGTDRKTIQEILDLLKQDPELGFEYKTSLAGSTWLSVAQVLVLGYPQVGSTLTREVAPLLTADYGLGIDGERQATRTHVMSADGPVTRQSASMVSNGALLMETVDDFSDGTMEMAIGRAKEMRRLLRSPGPKVPHVSLIPGEPLPYGFCDVGDTWPFNIREPEVLSFTADTRRVVEQQDACEVDGSELTTLVFNDPTTELGA